MGAGGFEKSSEGGGESRTPSCNCWHGWQSNDTYRDDRTGVAFGEFVVRVVAVRRRTEVDMLAVQ